MRVVAVLAALALLVATARAVELHAAHALVESASCPMIKAQVVAAGALQPRHGAPEQGPCCSSSLRCPIKGVCCGELACCPAGAECRKVAGALMCAAPADDKIAFVSNCPCPAVGQGCPCLQQQAEKKKEICACQSPPCACSSSNVIESVVVDKSLMK